MSMEEQGAPSMKDTPIYQQSWEYANEHQETDQYLASLRANEACSKTIENSVLSHHDGYHLDADAAIKEVVGAFGFDRTFYVLANTVQHKDWDGRFSQANIQWARTIPVAPDRDPANGEDRTIRFLVDRASPGLTDLFLQFVRRDFLRTQPLTAVDIVDEARRIGIRLGDVKDLYRRHRAETDQYPVEVSAEFVIRASQQDMDRLRNSLPYRGVTFGPVEGKQGCYAMIPNDEQITAEKEHTPDPDPERESADTEETRTEQDADEGARNAVLLEKMNAEQTAYRDWLLKQRPEEILNHTFEYTVRQDILTAVENADLSGEQAEALLRSNSPLADVFKDFQKRDTGYMDALRDCVGERANAEIRRSQEQQQTLKETPLYLFPGAYAREHGELDQYRASRRANIACRDAIDAAIQEHYQDFHVDAAAVQEIVRDFGYDRMLHVLANTVKQQDWDERFSRGNKFWAQSIPVYENPDGMGGDRNRDYVLRSHPVKADAFIDAARHEYLLTQPLKPVEIAKEANRIYAGLTEAKEPNSPSGTHFMVEISPDFLQRASDRDRDQLRKFLSFKSLTFSPLNGRKGLFALISKDEDRTCKAEVKKPFVRRKLKEGKEQPDAPAAEKPPTRRRTRKPEC